MKNKILILINLMLIPFLVFAHNPTGMVNSVFSVLLISLPIPIYYSIKKERKRDRNHIDDKILKGGYIFFSFLVRFIITTVLLSIILIPLIYIFIFE